MLKQPPVELITAADPVAVALARLRARTGERWRPFVDWAWAGGPGGGHDLFALFSSRVDLIGLHEAMMPDPGGGLLSFYFIRRPVAARFIEFLGTVFFPMPDGSVLVPTHCREAIGGFGVRKFDQVGFAWYGRDRPETLVMRQQLAAAN